MIIFKQDTYSNFKYTLKDSTQVVKIIVKPTNGTVRLYASADNTFPTSNRFEYL